jgi:hypothetical protein
MISPNTSDQHFDTAVLLNVVERSGHYVFKYDTPPPTALRAKFVIYARGAYKVFIESVVVKTSKRAHSIGNSEGYCLF